MEPIVSVQIYSLVWLDASIRRIWLQVLADHCQLVTLTVSVTDLNESVNINDRDEVNDMVIEKILHFMTSFHIFEQKPQQQVYIHSYTR